MLYRPVIGIDLGSQGGAVEVSGEGANVEIVSSIAFDEVGKKEIVEYFLKRRDRYFVVEKVSSSFGDGAVQAFTFGKWVGFITFMLEAIEIPYFSINSGQWSAFYRGKFGSFGFDEKSNKIRNEIWVRDHFKDICAFCKKKTRYHSGIVDSFLIANYFIEKYDTILEESGKKNVQKRTPKPRVPRASFI